ncbi:aminotransferase class V-fold PLP-dependent enzyme [Cytophagaceae bacterium YF14B1]|uniref:Aminotransferase class V-fold PLP-dependent enzyme n=1 Tax=Xanthocytophaga flava TaxID=3048013 RepID=A0AAE3QH01_9BACT|nr:aminotransferase class V-fold PLP-dependent enzyme [Xanthocytophaga flavus]MDJ1479217.1 aminotransferase class V-fold PLP-dependent enzyme [Xanthocytophaga flavus]
MRTRRDFLRKVGAATGAATLLPTFNPLKAQDILLAGEQIAHLSPLQAAADEDYWASIQQAYTASTTIINLNNGGVSPQPTIVQEAQDRYTRIANEAPSYYMWRIMDQGREPIRSKLADLAGCSPEEIAVNRNATEALATIIFGLTLRKGDEVVLTRQDYPNMIQAWKQREIRDEIKLKWINLDLPIESDEVFVQKFTEQFTAKTKVVYITHMINWTGQILPVRKIADAAHARGIEVVVDAAHTFAHLDYKLPDLGADYAGTSLHKWLCAPFGSGMLYVKKEKVKGLYPLFPNVDPKIDDIRKFEVLGTRSFAIEQAIGQAINFQNAIGTKRKEERLRYLKNYWCDKVKDLPRIKLNTSLKSDYSCALANFTVEGMEPGAIEAFLFNKYKIHTSPIVWENIKGVRVTPHVYTTLKDLDRLVEAITYLSKNKIS